MASLTDLLGGMSGIAKGTIASGPFGGALPGGSISSTPMAPGDGNRMPGSGGGGAYDGLGQVFQGASSISQSLGQIGSALGGGSGASRPDFKKGGAVKKYTSGGKINLGACGVSTHQKSKKSSSW